MIRQRFKLFLWWRFLFITMLMLVSQIGMAGNFPQLDRIYNLSANVVSDNTIQLNWAIEKQAYLYEKFIKLQVVDSKQGDIGRIVFPKSESINLAPFGEMAVYKKKLQLNVPIKNLEKDKKINLNLSYQGCSEEGICFPPVSHVLSVNFAKKVIAIDEQPVIQLSETQLIEQKLAGSHIVTMVGLFLGLGLLLAFTPCILPMIPILFGIIIKGHEKKSRLRAFFLSLSYVLGISFAYAFLGFLVSILGADVQGIFQNPYVIGCLGFIFILLALSLFGFFDIALPDSMTNALMHLSNRLNGKGYVGVCLMGFLSALIVSPCVTPPLVGALTYMATTGNVFTGTMVLFFLGFGMGLPLIAVAVLGKQIIPKAGVWMEGVKFLFGVLLLAVAVFLWQRVVALDIAMLLWGIFLIVVAMITLYYIQPQKRIMSLSVKLCAVVIFLAGLFLLITGLVGEENYLKFLRGENKTAEAQGYVIVTSMDQLQDYLEEAKVEHKPVLIDFYANWCLDCKSMDVSVFSKPDVKEELKRFMWIKVDVTSSTKQIIEIENNFSVIGPPAFIFISADGNRLDSLSFVGMRSFNDFMVILRQL